MPTSSCAGLQAQRGALEIEAHRRRRVVVGRRARAEIRRAGGEVGAMILRLDMSVPLHPRRSGVRNRTHPTMVVPRTTRAPRPWTEWGIALRSKILSMHGVGKATAPGGGVAGRSRRVAESPGGVAGRRSRRAVESPGGVAGRSRRAESLGGGVAGRSCRAAESPGGVAGRRSRRAESSGTGPAQHA